ncbi:DUF397 domain-containing protein [Kineosporia sp. NBRC 101731]|uniref:DUF397 domain-containing protein n=1 Tax=Kineosporia sp. NBRC 101731 TaxID=3032199 RepID=UPI0024A5AD9B|nr:DUF397 domain-containing protein [Kineosporia sp. NBRC 101731]GLY26820.1 hypothetical protein Kisp02_01850 [Kineosporia sp. NBRC 101731]
MTVETDWFKAAKSGSQNGCVEMRGNEGRVQVRDTKAKGAGPILTLTPVAFGAWVAGAKGGELDHLMK